MRLIDVEKLLDDYSVFGMANISREDVRDELYDLIDNQPTAYDIDKVVEELEKEKDVHAEHFNISIYKDMPEIKQRYKQAIGIIDKAIEIVKQQLKEQK